MCKIFFVDSSLPFHGGKSRRSLLGIASLRIIFLTKNRPKRNKYNGVSYLISFTKGYYDDGNECNIVKIRDSGAGAMVSSASDMAKFIQMMLQNGQLNGERVAFEKSIQAIESHHIGNV
ncbi:MAG: CubicO group peptidase (beta-lactamase class C family) [Flammeovirgaceae bacterium]|jgi:CubicO group peptidase (beta-lactamase class C family)